MSLALKRINKEIELLKSDKLPFGISVEPQDSLFVWFAYIEGGEGTPHQGLKYKLQIKIDDDYPTRPPSVKFISNCFHPNVYRDGKICLDILQGQWTPTMRIITTLISIQSLLDDPNPSSPANSTAAGVYSKSKEEYRKQVRENYKANFE
jgi:ubiquitin-protein ligase